MGWRTTTTRRPRAVWVGLGIRFRVTFALPEDQKKPYRFRFSQWIPPDRSEISKSEPPVEKVYEDMATGAFAKFADQFLEIAFGKP